MLSKKIILRFPPETVNIPVTCSLIKNFNIDVNIFKAKVNSEMGGVLGIELVGPKDKIFAALDWIKEQKLEIISTMKEFKKHSTKCIDCGFCVSVCPVKAITQDKKTLEVSVDTDKCVICAACAEACPLEAIDCIN